MTCMSLFQSIFPGKITFSQHVVTSPKVKMETMATVKSKINVHQIKIRIRLRIGLSLGFGGNIPKNLRTDWSRVSSSKASFSILDLRLGGGRTVSKGREEV